MVPQADSALDVAQRSFGVSVARVTLSPSALGGGGGGGGGGGNASAGAALRLRVESLGRGLFVVRRNSSLGYRPGYYRTSVTIMPDHGHGGAVAPPCIAAQRALWTSECLFA